MADIWMVMDRDEEPVKDVKTFIKKLSDTH